MRLAERCGLPALVGEHVRLPASKDGTGAFPAAKLMSLVGGMAAGADSIDDMDGLRHGAMGRLFSGVRALSTLGSFLRSFTHGHVKQLHAVARRFLPELARHTPLLPGADQAAYADIDDTIRRTHGYAKQGAGYGYSKVKGLNALLGVVSTPLSAPVIAATRLRKGPSNSARGAAAFVAETIRTARTCGARRPAGAAGGTPRSTAPTSSRLPGPGCPLLHHHADERLRQGHHRPHRRGRLDTDQISPRSGTRRSSAGSPTPR